MSLKPLYALDFDGVICDSALETAITGWKTAGQIWSDMTGPAPDVLVSDFREVRPLIETGYEAILAMRLLYQGYDKQQIFEQYQILTRALLEQAGVSVEQLKSMFGATRDHWIATNAADWITQNPLFPGVAECLQRWQGQRDWLIITTKQERFVHQILAAHDIALAADYIFGLDRNLSKVQVLEKWMARYPARPLVFIEDRLPTLLNVAKQPALQNVQLQLALWGYNSSAEQQVAIRHGMTGLELADFLAS